MAAYLLGFVLYFSPVPFPYLAVPDLSLPICATANMIKDLMRLLFSTGFSSTAPRDDDFFNEPSTMRPRLTAAAAAKESGPTEESASLSTSSAYQVVARGYPCTNIHYAAPSA
ncbi:hypothetical protein A1O7_06687 [Cladophialophora yegresii CBS 114405]|uniref:Uncharacterized protein n=1 Tax=Cladophialophora yegresii CBS 114405 TaxID=1182544 RepID=W9W2M1_9EURO|nr:uncharacterized protein A1O7_06687 [Cladophialophora yegresii CBS 114405]EXJ59255.1 hypothetical protein A1O7_06687 [Cladophialophora yegresii CBS 114405]